MSSLERVDCIFQCLVRVAVVEEYICYICIEASDFDCIADFSAIKNCIQRFESIYCRNLSAVYVLFRIKQSPVTCISSTSRYLVGLFHTLLS